MYKNKFYYPLLFLILLTSCNKTELIQSSVKTEKIQVRNNMGLNSNCDSIILFNYQNIGYLHNQYLLDILENGQLDTAGNLILQINEYISLKSESLKLEDFLGGNPLNSAVLLINENLSGELQDFGLSIISYLYNTNGILDNNQYQDYISQKVNEIPLLSIESDRIKALRMLSVLSYSIDFWLPEVHCGKNGYSLVTDIEYNNQIQARAKRSWLTNFADIWSHDCVGALFGGWSPPTAAAGFAGASALRGLSLAWDRGY